jgi:cellulose biosynthesis protein BcsQ
MLKLKDVKESSLERELKNKISDLQEEIKVKDERYTILLEKFETYQKQEKERLREEKEKENEIKTVNEIMSKSSSV